MWVHRTNCMTGIRTVRCGIGVVLLNQEVCVWRGCLGWSLSSEQRDRRCCYIVYTGRTSPRMACGGSRIGDCGCFAKSSSTGVSLHVWAEVIASCPLRGFGRRHNIFDSMFVVEHAFRALPSFFGFLCGLWVSLVCHLLVQYHVARTQRSGS